MTGGLAEELAQEAFVRTWHRWNAIRQPEAAPAYLRTTAVNLARSGARMRLREIRAWLAVPTRTPSEPDVSTDVLRALAQLPRRKRECVVLRYYLDLSEADTAAVLGVTAGTIKSQTAKALRRLQTLLTDTSALQGNGVRQRKRHMIDHGTTARNLRLGLDRAATSNQLSPDSWTQIERRLVSRRRPRMAIAAMAAAVAVATVIAVTLYLHPPLPAPRISGSPPSQQLVVASRLHMAQAVSRVAAGAGAVWVGGLNVTYRVNPATNNVVATIPTPGTDEFSQLAVGARSVWVSGGNGPGYQLGVYRIDPHASKVTAFIDLQRTGLPGPVVIARGWVWVVVGNLYRINPRTNRIVGPRFEFGGDIGSLVPAAGALWVTNTNGGGSVSRIDLRTGASASLNPAVWSKITDIDASGAGSLWMSGTNVVDRVDPVSGRITAAIFLPGVDRVYFWRNSASSSAGTASIVRVDPATNKVTGQAVRLGSGPEAVAAGPTGIWAVNIGDQQLLHIVLRTIPRG